MNFQGQIVLVCLEEDNIAKAYFRIKPLMTQDGPIGETKEAFPDDGFLRIVPDRNEQHTFKERMRSMCGLCMIDLRNQPPEANKIRTNKNYSPSRGETNQFIIYSDAVRALPDDLLFQVVPDGALATASTSRVYIRNGANIQGPFLRENGQPVGETAPLQPDSPEIHAVTVNGQDLLFYWPRVEAPRQAEEAPKAETAAEKEPAQESAAQPDPQQNAYDTIQALNVAPSANANRLHEPAGAAPVDFIPEQPQRPLTGTRLYQTPQKQPPMRRAHNALMETVERERYVGRYEAPGATLPQSAELKDVQNPADSFKRALSSLWQSPETQKQAVDMVLSHPGMRIMLSKAVSKEANDLTVAAMHSQLQELEAERLMTLMQLDDVKKNLSAAREEALGKLTAAEQKKLDELHIAQQQAKNALDGIEKAAQPLEKAREEAAAALKEMEDSLVSPVRLVTAKLGSEQISREQLAERTEKALKAAGFDVEDGDALALLFAFSLSPRAMQFASAHPEDADQAIAAFAAALGIAVEDADFPDQIALTPGGNAPVLVKNKSNLPASLATGVFAVANAEMKNEYYLPLAPSVAFYPALDTLPEALPVFEPVSKDAILRAMKEESALSDDTKAVVIALRKAMAEAGKPLPLLALDQMCRFIAASQNIFKGGVAEAIDRAVCLYATPYMLGLGKQLDDVKPLLAAMPRTLKALNA